MDKHQIMNHSSAEPLPAWKAPPKPQQDSLRGQYCYLEKLDAKRHSHDLYQAYSTDSRNSLWQFLPYGPFANETELYDFIDTRPQSDPLFYAIIDIKSQRALTAVPQFEVIKKA